jgi:hypothetical protein
MDISFLFPSQPTLEISIHQHVALEESDGLLSMVMEMSCADLIRNWPWLVGRTKQDTIQCVADYLKKSTCPEELMVLRDKQGFQIITWMPRTKDAQSYLPSFPTLVVYI